MQGCIRMGSNSRPIQIDRPASRSSPFGWLRLDRILDSPCLNHPPQSGRKSRAPYAGIPEQASPFAGKGESLRKGGA